MCLWVEENGFSGGGIGMENEKGLREGSKRSSIKNQASRKQKFNTD
jgi:hypothetical protein